MLTGKTEDLSVCFGDTESKLSLRSLEFLEDEDSSEFRLSTMKVPISYSSNLRPVNLENGRRNILSVCTKKAITQAQIQLNSSEAMLLLKVAEIKIILSHRSNCPLPKEIRFV